MKQRLVVSPVMTRPQAMQAAYRQAQARRCMTTVQLVMRQPGVLVAFPTTNGWTTAVPDGGAGSDNGGGDWAACHGTYFDSHTHHSVANDVTCNVGTDTSQTSVTGCAVCHNDNLGALGSWSDIYVAHSSTCSDCHSYAGGASAPLATVQLAISSGSAATCATCHTDKTPNVDHANPHPTNDFAWDGNCSSCHTGANVVADIHEGTCTTCHASSAANLDNEIVGDGTDGIDGDATQANYTAAGSLWATVTCTTCHDGVGTTTTNLDAHHLSVAGASTCSDCHDGTGSDIRLADHSGLVATYVNCSTCHTDVGMVIASGDNKVHDDCTTCHQSDGSLETFPTTNGWTTAMPDGGVGTNNGGGSCCWVSWCIL